MLNYCLPSELIAQVPSEKRSQSRLLAMDRGSGAFCDRRFSDIIEYLRPGDCLVLNNTKVMPARFYGRRMTGARLEGLLLSSQDDKWTVMLKNARKVKLDETIVLCDRDGKDSFEAKIAQRLDDGRVVLEVDTGQGAEDVLSQIGFAPLPPYIKRKADKEMNEKDMERYQTVYAKTIGAVAAPTAGLHFTEELMRQISETGIKLAYVTLHVGAGTFKPVTADDLDDHDMHSERFSITQNDADVINAAKRIVAVGTTSVRTLETVGKDGKIEAGEGETKLFIQPGFEFQIVDAMITNFHLPKSTLIALVGAFAEMANVMSAYRHAIEERYRFFSYGDAMFIADI